MGQWCFFSKYILKRKQVLLAFYMEMVSSSSSKGSKWQFSMANWSSTDWGGFQVLDSLYSGEVFLPKDHFAANTAGPQRVTLVSARGEQHSTAILQSSSPGPQGLQKSSNPVYIRSQIESHSLPVFEALGPHVKIQPSSNPWVRCCHWGLRTWLWQRCRKTRSSWVSKDHRLRVGWGVRLMCS